MAHYTYNKQALTANGGATGVLTVADTSGFRIGALASLEDSVSTQGVYVRIVGIPDGIHLYCRVVDTSKCQDPFEAPLLLAYGGTSGLNAAGNVPSLDLTAWTTTNSANLVMPDQDVTTPDRLVRLIGGIDQTGTAQTLMLGPTGKPAFGWQGTFLTASSVIVPTTTADADATIPADGWYELLVSTEPAAIQVGATSSGGAIWQPGAYGPFYFYNVASTGDGKLHASSTTGSGQVALVPMTARMG